MLTTRRAVGRERKLASLEKEFSEWEREIGPEGDLRLHHSQIGRILSVLRPLRSRVAEPSKMAGTAAILSDREIEVTALELHRMWEFFRSKFAMRKVAWLKKYLDAVDDFAWACYKPVRDAAEATEQITAGALKEPPLLFFGGGWSPFAMSRDYPYEAEEVPREPVRNEAFKQALQKLPVPVVGLPWFQVAHLPDAVVIGHEVGHLVEDDLGLQATIAATVSGTAPAVRRDAWKSWSGEIFGDFYGQLATGPAFVSGLAEALSDDAKWIVGETPPKVGWGNYPTTYLRMRLNFAMLRALGYENDAVRLEGEWTDAYGPTHAVRAYDADVAEIAKKLCDMQVAALGGKKLGEVFSFDALRNDTAVAVEWMEAGQSPPPGNVRGLVAASRLFFDAHPDAYTTELQQKVLDTIKASLPKGTRGEVTEADESLTNDLIELLSGRRRAAISEESVS